MDQKLERPGLAALWMLGAIGSFSCMAVAGREVSAELDTFELMLYRSIVGVFIISAVLTVQRRWSETRTQRIHVHLARNVAHFTGQNLWFYALLISPMAQVFAIEFTHPIWVVVLAPLLLGETFSKVRMLSAAMGFLGILIIVRPGTESVNAGVITASLAALCFAITTIFTKKLTRTDSVICIMFWLTVIQTLLGLLASGYDLDITVPSAQYIPWVVLVSICGLLAHFCLTTALSMAPASFVIPIDFARLPTIAVVGMLLYSEPLDPWVFAGAVVIFAGIYINIQTEARKNKRLADA